MAESETSLSDMMYEMDLGAVHNTGYERDVDIEVSDGFYYKSIAFMNDKVHLFADFWMTLYSTCCLQRDSAVKLMNDGKPDEAKDALNDWPTTIGSPQVPHLLFNLPKEPKRKKLSTLSLEESGIMLINEMVNNVNQGKIVLSNIPNIPETNIS